MKPDDKKIQTEIIFAALLRGEILTPITSLNNYKVHSLSQVCTRINREASYGTIILSQRVPGHRYHRYYIHPDVLEYYPWICFDCGKRWYIDMSRARGLTVHTGFCGWCGEKKAVLHYRNYGFPPKPVRETL